MLNKTFKSAGLITDQKNFLLYGDNPHLITKSCCCQCIFCSHERHLEKHVVYWLHYAEIVVNHCLIFSDALVKR